MKSIINEIMMLRSGKEMKIDRNNTNRYRVVVQEENGSKTAYYFSTPIYNADSRKAIDLKFHKNNSGICAVGSNAEITVTNMIRMKTKEELCYIPLKGKAEYISDNELHCYDDILLPAANGVVYLARAERDCDFSFELEVGTPFMNVRANDKSFCLMREKFRPFMTVSCIGTINRERKVIAPAKISYEKLSDRKYRLTVKPCSTLGIYTMFEINLYEPKLFQDTTVESRNTKINNAYGSTAFIGNTEEFGEQWLYTRADFSKISDLADKRIEQAILHLPKHNSTDVELSAFKVKARFCSFGSNWNNKIASAGSVGSSSVKGEHQNLDVTALICDPRERKLIPSEGMILKTKIKGSGFSVIATGDSYYAPQILEIHYKN